MFKLLPNTVINFHAVYDETWMEKVLRLLKKLYRPVAIQELEAFYYDNKPLKNTCHITFDDGDQSFFYTVFPLLKKHDFPASIYVSPKAITERTNFWFQEMRGYDKSILWDIIKTTEYGRELQQDMPLGAVLKSMKLENIWKVIHAYREKTNTPPKPCVNMDLEQILELHKSGLVAVGAHTLSHPILKNEDDKTAEKEIIQSIHGLSKLLCRKVKYFAYPNGIPDLDFGEREKQLVKEAGCQIAFSTKTKRFTIRDDYYSMPRNGLTKGNTLFVVSKLFAGNKWVVIKQLLNKKLEDNFRKNKKS